MTGAVRNRNTPRWTVQATVGLTMVLLIMVLYIAVRAVAFESFGELERDAANHDVARIERAYENRLEALEIITGDWAPWDDTYDFVVSGNPEYVESNLSPGVLENLDVDVMAFFDQEGHLVHLALSPESGTTGEAIRDRLSGLNGSPDLAPGTSVDDSLSGIIPTDAGPLMFAAQPITTSLQDQPPNGMLLVGRRLDDVLVGEIASATQIELSGAPPSATDSEILHAGGSAVAVRDQETLLATLVLEDWSGAPAISLRALLPRDVMHEGRRAVSLLGVALALLGLVSTTVIQSAVRRAMNAMDARVVAERGVRVAEARYRALVDSMADAVFGVDADGILFLVNPRASRLTGRTPGQLVGSHYRDIMTPDSAAHIVEAIDRDRDGSSTWEATLLDDRGDQVPVEIGVSWYRESPDALPRMQWVARDVAERKRFEHELVHLATHDHLTGLFNRMRFEEELEGRLASVRRTGSVAALLWLDLDNFKEVNDSLGHRAGDDILVAMAVELSRRLRADSIVARLGGDEFGVLMPEVGRDEIEMLAHRVLEEIRTIQFVTSEGTVRLTPSIGVVILPDHATTSEEALARADLAMYRAKEYGRNQVCVYRPDEDWEQELRTRFDWAVAIESALRDGRLVVHWQPILDLATGEIDRYELLVRMQAEDGSVVPPGSFLPVAERLGLISEIDKYMIRRAIALLTKHPDDGVRVDVNLSGKALSSPDLPVLLADELERSDVDPSRLGIEITETAAVIDMIKARAFIETVKRLGVRVSLDDFGSGFSSFYYLRNLPIDTLKIDGSFVRELVENHRDRHVVRSIVELARGLGIATTAECVESAEILELLRSFGVDHAQGFHIAHPTPVDTD